jgi:hypothetical protein
MSEFTKFILEFMAQWALVMFAVWAALVAFAWVLRWLV